MALGNVIELEAIEGPALVTVEENRLVAGCDLFTASSDEDRDGITWTLGVRGRGPFQDRRATGCSAVRSRCGVAVNLVQTPGLRGAGGRRR